MKIYLVGGAVRDKLLGYPVQERDWVVVGATAEELQALGYQQVGRDFPVFLHPKTKEEYALARTERKSGSGYYGFQCDFRPNVSLKEDLLRRDLTINAMAMDEEGKIIDPYQGQKDLKEKILRHVSPAFMEDPVRVLRLARFAARYYHLGFKVADETRALMYAMVKRGELAHLIAERVWQEWYRSLQERNPEIFITTLRSCGALKIVFPEIDALFGVPNPAKHHAEIDSGVHSLMVLKVAARLSEDPIVRFAALVHDLGKAATPVSEWPSQIQHEMRGIPIIKALCERLRIPADYRKFAEMASRFHLNIHRLFELKASTKIKILEKADAFRRPNLFEKLLVVCEADAKGRGFKEKDYKQAEAWRRLLTECLKISVQEIIAQGYKGEAIKQVLHQQRVYCAEQFGNNE
ncbi:multifunctional CCA addition/repair protein [Legionella jordanis]|uniref:Multifunctional CCA protein n=1 Tax=Legionella jordanis TaxID=456 RepID=A0A0W0VCJ4_9GAMM|nr:multifunctional CCA addition/repair protein [Legionella jordanis]KTD17574.1 tRNA nucleotidyltransferase [Legionella jordanis]RMX05091.1 multifunctional CCA addition/repair protein [Legionella jordanis]RMX17346.1 multifunctional CCA addition/repair protein [Legionella jordanis]VEH13543.1 tRNA nucleotidyltransferase [Legionella jordanis]HAT8714459.1 multifunctional CCA addition/repair protein [Legionella jordanis]